MDIDTKHRMNPVSTDTVTVTTTPAEIEAPKVCPHCGHCPHCGSPAHPVYPKPWPPHQQPYIGDVPGYEVTPFWYSTSGTYGGSEYSGS